MHQRPRGLLYINSGSRQNDRYTTLSACNWGGIFRRYSSVFLYIYFQYLLTIRRFFLSFASRLQSTLLFLITFPPLTRFIYFII